MVVLITLVNTMWCSLVIKKRPCSPKWTVCLEPCWCKKSPMEESTIYFFCISAARSLSLSVLFSLLSLNVLFHLNLTSSLHLFLLFVLQKKHSPLSLPEKEFLMETHYSGRGKKKIPASLAQLPVQLFCLPLCFLIMLELNTPRHLNQCRMLCFHCVHTFLTLLGSHRHDQWTQTACHVLGSLQLVFQTDKALSNPLCRHQKQFLYLNGLWCPLPLLEMIYACHKLRSSLMWTCSRSLISETSMREELWVIHKLLAVVNIQVMLHSLHAINVGRNATDCCLARLDLIFAYVYWFDNRPLMTIAVFLTFIRFNSCIVTVR